MRERPVVGITAGDLAGIGPELVRELLRRWNSDEAEARVIGRYESVSPGQPTAETARAAWDALEQAAASACNGDVDAIVTGPVCKHALHAIGFPYPGQTEFFAARCGVQNFAMVLTGGSLTVGLVTIHEPLAKVASLLNPELIFRRGCLLAEFLHAKGVAHPRVAVAGLNPHAGENGSIGTEEREIISPAVERLKAEGRGLFEGPFSPDTVFRECLRGKFDAVLCMYHDQGLIPLKLVAFDEGVNVTVGLPFYRTSPDHGTAFALAGKGLASPGSMLAAARLAVQLARNRIASRATKPDQA